MAGNLAAILSGVAGGGAAKNALSYFAPLGTTLPTAADSTLDVGFQDLGWVTSDGLSRAVAESSTQIDGYGTQVPLRVLTTSSTITFDIAWLETNKYTLAVYNRLALSTLTPDSAGRVAFGEGAARVINYAVVFNVVDGSNLIRLACPNLQVTDRQSLTYKAGSAVAYGVTLTAYPGSDGDAVKHQLLVPGLIGT